MMDVVVIGEGPAGMSAALVAGRGKKQDLLIDEEKPRNAVTHASHAFLTQDGIKPEVFREKGRKDLLKYPTISIKTDKVLSVEKAEEGSFEITVESGENITTKNVVLAAGLKEKLPDVKGIEDYYGSSIFSCPFCDGWEMKEKPLILITESSVGLYSAKLLKNWTDELIVATNGIEVFDAEQKKLLELNDIRLIEERIVELDGVDGELQGVAFESREKINISGGFCTTLLDKKFSFIDSLDIELTEAGFVVTDSLGRTNVKGIYAAGEITGPSQLIVSASQGHMAGIGIITDSSEAAFEGI